MRRGQFDRPSLEGGGRRKTRSWNDRPTWMRESTKYCAHRGCVFPGLGIYSNFEKKKKKRKVGEGGKG